MRLLGCMSLLSAPPSRRLLALSSCRHVRCSSEADANMAEEAKKLAAYAAVDNHVQVPTRRLS